MPGLDDAPLFQPADRAAWRAWLEANHATSRGVWLVTWRRRSSRQPLAYEDRIEEALCFGWVDSTGGRVDDQRGKLCFAPRKPRSVWAGTNKARVERLVARASPASGDGGDGGTRRAARSPRWPVGEAPVGAPSRLPDGDRVG